MRNKDMFIPKGFVKFGKTAYLYVLDCFTISLTPNKCKEYEEQAIYKTKVKLVELENFYGFVLPDEIYNFYCLFQSNRRLTPTIHTSGKFVLLIAQTLLTAPPCQCKNKCQNKCNKDNKCNKR